MREFAWAVLISPCRRDGIFGIVVPFRVANAALVLVALQKESASPTNELPILCWLQHLPARSAPARDVAEMFEWLD